MLIWNKNQGHWSSRLTIACVLAAASLAASNAFAASTLDAKIKEINARYEQTYKRLEREGERLGERAPEGAETAVGVDVKAKMKRHEIILDLPTINMREKRIVLDLPQVTMKNRRFSFTIPKTKMVNKKTGQYPETRCTDTWINLPFGGKTKGVPKCTITWSDIITKIPVIRNERTEFFTKVPEFKVAQTTIVMHLPDVSMARQRIVFDLPDFELRDVKVETKRIEADARALEKRTQSTSKRHKAEINALVRSDLSERKADVAKQFDAAISQMKNALDDMRSQGIDPAKVEGVDLIAQLSALRHQKSDALREIDDALSEVTS